MTTTESTSGLPLANACRWRHLALIALVCLPLYLAGNGRVSLWDRDEAWYAQTAREMVQRGNYIVPQFNGEPRYRKPAMIYWLMAASYSLLGDNEFAARFFSGVAGTVTCLITYRLGCRMAGPEVGLVAALMLAVAPFMVIESKLATTDAALTAMICGAFTCLFELFMIGPSRNRSVAFWLLVAGMILTKGPFGLAFVLSGVVVWLVLGRRWSVARRLDWVAGPLVALAVCLPWGLAIYRATDGEFYRVAIGDQALGHSLSRMNNHGGFPGYYAALLLAGLLPWSLFVPLTWRGIRQWYTSHGPKTFLLGWAIGPMVMLELMRTKLPQYYLPAFPAWALLIAYGMVETYRAGHRVAWMPAGLRRIGMVGAFGAITAAAGLAGGWMVLPSGPSLAAIVAGSIMGIGAMAVVVLLVQKRDMPAWATGVAIVWCVSLTTAAWLVPQLEPYRVPRAAADSLNGHADQTPIVLFGYREPSLVYYIGRPVPSFGGVKEMKEFLDRHRAAMTLLRESDMEKLRSKEPEIAIEVRDRIERRGIRGSENSAITVARLTLIDSVEPVARSARESAPPKR